MKKPKIYWSWILAFFFTVGISFLGFSYSSGDSAIQKRGIDPNKKDIIKKGNDRIHISDQQHRKDLKQIKEYLKVYGKKSQQGDRTFTIARVIDKITKGKIQKGYLTADRPFKHNLLLHNVDAKAIFVKLYAVDQEQKAYVGEKKFSDYNFDGMKLGTKDNIELTFYNSDFSIFVSSNLDFFKSTDYKAYINSDTFIFSGGEKDFQRRIKKGINEYKKAVHNIAQISTIKKHNKLFDHNFFNQELEF